MYKLLSYGDSSLLYLIWMFIKHSHYTVLHNMYTSFLVNQFRLC
jgi:hypothetical protein